MVRTFDLTDTDEAPEIDTTPEAPRADRPRGPRRPHQDCARRLHIRFPRNSYRQVSIYPAQKMAQSRSPARVARTHTSASGCR